MEKQIIQDLYSDDFSHCYGCGRLNDHGLQIKSVWDGKEAVAIYHPRPYEQAFPGYVYGGLLASLIDCHAIGTAAAARYAAEGRPMGSEPQLRYVTASLKVDFLRPTPMKVPLEVRAHATEIKGRKVVLEASVLAEGEVCATGHVVAVQMPDYMANLIESK